MSTALAFPPESLSLKAQRSTHAALISEVVNLPAQTAPLGASTSAKSGLPESFKPADKPEALNPFGAAIPPFVGIHNVVIN